MAPEAPPWRSNPTLSVVVPTYQEAANVPLLFDRMKTALDGLPWEMIVVDDDSPDGTSNVAFTIAVDDRRLRCLRRVRRSGLAGAVIEGWLSSSADLLAVIDGDLQHDETIIPLMYKALAKGPCRFGDRNPGEQRGQRWRSISRAASIEQPGGLVFPTTYWRGGQGSDERLLHASARNRLWPRAAPFARWLQDPGRYHPYGWRQPADRRGSVRCFASG